MTSLSETLLTAAGLFGLGASAASVGSAVEASAFDLSADDATPLSEGRSLSPEVEAADDPFFTAVADALRAAGYLDS